MQLAIEGMTCAHCVAHVKAALEAVPGVQRVTVDLATGQATIEGEVTFEALARAVAEEGYTARRQA